MVIKRIFLLIPVLVIILSCWLTVGCLIAIIFRQRKKYINSIFYQWWELFRAIFTYWSGIFKFALHLCMALIGFFKTIILGLFILLQDIFYIPFNVVRNIGGNIIAPGIPWIAVTLTIFWCIFEAAIFTYVTSPIVIDTLSNITGEQLSETFIRLPLYGFMLFIILGSYSVLSIWTQSVRSKDWASIIKIGMIELVTLFVEVMFLYREFVDALVPWFAQHSDGFELGLFGTITIACMTWFGMRSLSWFLFAGHGTPTIMAIIQGSGLKSSKSKDKETPLSESFTINTFSRIKDEMTWVNEKGDELIGSFILPPLQVIGSAVNFCTLLILADRLFELPFTSMDDVVKKIAQMSKNT